MNRDFFRVFFDGDGGDGGGGGNPAPGTGGSLLGDPGPPPQVTPPVVPPTPEPTGPQFPEDLSTVDLSQGRPEYVPEKYFNAETGELRGLEAIKSAVTLESKLAKMANGVNPEIPAEATGYFGDALFDTEGKCKVEVPEGYAIGKDDPLLAAVAQDALAAQIPTAVFQTMVESFLRNSGANGLAAQEAYEQEQMEALGEEGKSLKISNTAFLQALRQSGELSESEFQLAFTGLNSSADGVRLTAKLAALASGTTLEQIPPTSDPTPGGSPKFTRQELQERVADPRYETDTAFREETSKGFEELFGTGPAPEGAPPEPLPQYRS